MFLTVKLSQADHGPGEPSPDDAAHPDKVQDVKGHKANIECQNVPGEVFSGMRHGFLVVIGNTTSTHRLQPAHPLTCDIVQTNLAALRGSLQQPSCWMHMPLPATTL